MKWEGFKTLLLAVLVMLSLVLTWNLWTYHSNSVRLAKPTFSEISPNGKRAITQVVRPDQAIFHDDGNNYGVVSGTDLTKMFEMITGAQLDKVQICGNDLTHQKVKNCELNQPTANSVEMIFPTPIPISLFGAMVQQSGKNQSSTSYLQFTSKNSLEFNRIVYYKAGHGKPHEVLAYFMDRKKIVAEADVSNVSFASLKNFYQDKKVFLSRKHKGRTFYFPLHPKPEKLRYNFNLIDASRFEKALFSNQNVLYHQKNYFATTNQSLRISSDHAMRFENGEQTSGQTKNAAVSGNPPDIATAFEYVNSHSGWTDSYMLFQYSKSKENHSLQGTVAFRLMMGKGANTYPVFDSVTEPFSYEDAGTILLTLEDGNVNQYMRTMINVTNKTPYLEHKHLSTGEEVWQQLETSKKVLMANVQNLCVGYEMNVTSKDTAMFIPHWFVLYNGNWTTVSDLTRAKKTGHEGAAP